MKKLAKYVTTKDTVVTKAGHKCKVTLAERRTDRGQVPHTTVMAIGYEVPFEPGVVVSLFPLRFHIEVVDGSVS